MATIKEELIEIKVSQLVKSGGLKDTPLIINDALLDTIQTVIESLVEEQCGKTAVVEVEKK